jgi:hypothetical protein
LKSQSKFQSLVQIPARPLFHYSLQYFFALRITFKLFYILELGSGVSLKLCKTVVA